MHRRKLAMIIACGAAVIASVSSAAPAFAAPADLFVGTTNCLDTGPGTQDQPLCTLARAATVAIAGQTVQVLAGTYAGGATVQNSGSAGSPITFQPFNGAAVTVDGSLGSPTPPANAFRINGKSYVTVRGFTITGFSSNGIAVVGTTALSSDHISIENNTVTKSGTSAARAAGIYFTNTSASQVTGNTSDGNTQHGILLAAGATGVTVRGNEASGNGVLPFTETTRLATGITVSGPGNSIIGNVLHDNEDSGIQAMAGGAGIPGGDDTLVSDNVTYNNGDHGIDNRDVSNGRLTGNTVYHNCASGINIEGNSLNFVVKNNIAVDNAVLPAYLGVACNRRAGNIGVWDTSTATLDSNLVHLTVGGTMYAYNGVKYTSLAAFRAAQPGQEAHGLQADPRFVDPAAFKLQLRAGSRAIDSADSGADGEQTVDLAGQPRMDDQGTPDTGLGPRTYDDRGAYEFKSARPLGGALRPVTPARILDTRSGNGAPAAPVPANGGLDLQVTGRGGVPATGVTAVVLNITVTAPVTSGYITVYPSGGTRPASSNLNFVARQSVPNLVNVAVGTGGRIRIENHSSGTVQLIGDVTGWFATSADSTGRAGLYHPIAPFRLLDTRSSAAMGPATSVKLQVTGRSGSGSSVPATGVSAVVLNVTVTQPTASGFVTVSPTNVVPPPTSTVNFVAGLTVANRTIVPVGPDGSVYVYNSRGNTQVIVDVAGWYTNASSVAGGATFLALGTPQRLADSRPGSPPPDTPWGPNTSRAIAVAGHVGVPPMTDANPPVAVVANVTATNATAASFLTVYPGGAVPVASDLNFVKGATVPNLTIARLAADGSVWIYNRNGNVDVIVDVFGWYA